MKYDYIIIGSGLAGLVSANILASRNKKILLLEKRNHLGGNIYEEIQGGLRYHKYGPHIFHTNNKKVFDYLSKYIDWLDYEHKVLGYYTGGKLAPIPFNFKTLEKLFDSKKVIELKNILAIEYPDRKEIKISELKNSNNKELLLLIDTIYEQVFKHYTSKQWGKNPEKLDKSIMDRVPINLSNDDRYFKDEIQKMPKNGFNELINKLVDNENINIKINVDGLKDIEIIGREIFYKQKKFTGNLIFTGMLDQLFNYRFGKLPYRSLEFELKELQKKKYQGVGTVNYPTPKNVHPYTRITEFKYLTKEKSDNTLIMYEYPKNYTIGDEPYYPLLDNDSKKIYKKYKNEVEQIPNLHTLGRLSEFKYYNMDQIILKVLDYWEYNE